MPFKLYSYTPVKRLYRACLAAERGSHKSRLVSIHVVDGVIHLLIISHPTLTHNDNIYVTPNWTSYTILVELSLF